MYSFINNIKRRPVNKFKKHNPSNNSPPQSSFQMDPMREAKTVSLFSQPYLDTYNKCYKNIVVINLMPQVFFYYFKKIIVNSYKLLKFNSSLYFNCKICY